ncbi:polypeptide N-acetylgalactosaminyltransferase 11 [Aplysia californica]|uniref:Polypeptide N-acetylgalactosaminyltransferase n=1 Tax=Aplysia californica TaxID=6500 RepID=A0ABM0JAU9_APLCA|nr:polypeptide N-acetylgalactosaminyltransferase 11 [Aplysia californica]
MVRLRRSRLILILVVFSIFFWFVLYWNFLGVYTRHKQRLLSKSGLHDKLPNDEFPFDYGEVQNEQDAIKNNEIEIQPGNPSKRKIYDESYLQQLGKINTAQDQRNYDAGYHNHAFNEMLSAKLSYTRPIPDVRNSKCRKKHYPVDLPSASIIICFHNEARSALLRTVHTVLARSSEHLIHEIILVDDFSTFEHLKSELENTISTLPKVKLVRSPERQGLIRARMLGAEEATGQVLLFLDSHCEVNVGWLEPLLAVVHSDRQTVAVPLMDIVDSDTFYYEPAGLVRGGFNWGMHFQWDPLPLEDSRAVFSKADPFVSPTMAGGLFAMDRKYFKELGEYDSGMDIWGGENLELSFRIWQCGGRLLIVPCSRVGHIFRKRRPYGSPVRDSFTKNTLRVVHVWMDDYKKYYFHINPRAEDMEYGSIKDRLELRDRLQCKSFQWYLDNVYPSALQKLPDLARSLYPTNSEKKINSAPEVAIRAWGLLKHTGSGLCVQSEKSIYDKRSLLQLAVCKHGKNEDQLWYETEQKDLRLANLLCLDYNREEGPYARLMKCKGSNPQTWIWSKRETHERLLNYETAQCLTATGIEPGALLKTMPCNDSPLTHFELFRT